MQLPYNNDWKVPPGGTRMPSRKASNGVQCVSPRGGSKSRRLIAGRLVVGANCSGGGGLLVCLFLDENERIGAWKRSTLVETACTDGAEVRPSDSFMFSPRNAVVEWSEFAQIDLNVAWRVSMRAR